MIGFQHPGPHAPYEERRDPNEYMAVRRSRFIRLGIDSDDWVFVYLLVMFVAGILAGVMLRASL